MDENRQLQFKTAAETLLPDDHSIRKEILTGLVAHRPFEKLYNSIVHSSAGSDLMARCSVAVAVSSPTGPTDWLMTVEKQLFPQSYLPVAFDRGPLTSWMIGQVTGLFELLTRLNQLGRFTEQFEKETMQLLVKVCLAATQEAVIELSQDERTLGDAIRRYALQKDHSLDRKLSCQFFCEELFKGMIVQRREVLCPLGRLVLNNVSHACLNLLTDRERAEKLSS